MTTIITIINSIAIILVLFHSKGYYVNIRKDVTFFNRTLMAYKITLWRRLSAFSSTGVYTITIPVANRKKIELQEEVQRMMQYSEVNKRQSLRAKFSHLKTWDEVRKFEKDYSVVGRKIVENLVSNFQPK
jgi:hypothetical protein